MRLKCSGCTLFIGEICHNIVQRAIQQLAEHIESVGGHRVPGFHAANGGTADAALYLQGVRGCTTLLHGAP